MTVDGVEANWECDDANGKIASVAHHKDLRHWLHVDVAVDFTQLGQDEIFIRKDVEYETELVESINRHQPDEHLPVVHVLGESLTRL
jgi:hypothetical protein